MNTGYYGSYNTNRKGKTRSILLMFFCIFLALIMLMTVFQKYIKVKAAGERVHISWLVLEHSLEQRAEIIDILFDRLRPQEGVDRAVLNDAAMARDQFYGAVGRQEKIIAAERLIETTMPLISIAASNAGADTDGHTNVFLQDLAAIEKTLGNDINKYNASVANLQLVSSGVAGDMMMAISGGSGFRAFVAGAHTADGSNLFLD